MDPFGKKPCLTLESIYLSDELFFRWVTGGMILLRSGIRD